MIIKGAKALFHLISYKVSKKMIKALIQLIKNIFSSEPFEQIIEIEFGIEDIVAALILIYLIFRLCQ